MADKYGITRIKQGDTWEPLRGLWYKTDTGWTPVKTAWRKNNDGQWERVYPTPSGVNTPSIESADLTVYKNYTQSQTISFTNTGEYDLIIEDVESNDGNKTYTTLNLAGINGGVPYTIHPGQSGSITATVFGNAAGTSTGNIVVINNTGFFGSDGNISYWPGNKTVIPITTTVLPNFAAINVDPTTINLDYYQTDFPVVRNARINNIGNGENLIISSITISGDVNLVTNVTAINVPTFIGFDFNTYTGNSAEFTLSITGLEPGEYKGQVNIYSNARNVEDRKLSIPLTINVPAVSGSVSFSAVGSSQWTVPDGVKHITITAIGGGGGSGGSTEVGNGGAGGGGGSGGVNTQTVTVTPGDIITMTIGRKGEGSPFVGRNPGASGAGGPGGSGGATTVSGSFGTITASGGSGGNSGSSGGGGAGGAGGSPGGVAGSSGTSGTRDNSSTTGGAGGENGTGFGSGGRGADAPDRVSPYQWAGSPGTSGAVIITY